MLLFQVDIDLGLITDVYETMTSMTEALSFITWRLTSVSQSVDGLLRNKV